MRLRDTVKRFTTEVYTDAFSSATFTGHMAPYNEVTNSGVSAHRRILETFPDVVIPTSRVVYDTSNRHYIVAAKNKDFWEGSEIRDKYAVLIPSGTGAVGDIGETLAGTAASGIYVFPYFVRREIAERDLSDYLGGFEIYFSSDLTFERGSILSFGSDHYRLVSDTRVDGAGFSVAQGLKVENAIQSLSVVSTTSYDPTTDTYPAGAPAAVTCFVELMYKDYEFVNPSFDRVESGDKAISVLKSAATLKTNDMIGDYRILSVRDMGDFGTAHCRYHNV